jgi:hypothetical protein
MVDTWMLLEMPESCYYHKHLMYNAGIAFSRGEIIVFCDSDAMVRTSFIDTISSAFERHGKIVLHLDQFRNMRRDFYPFNYPGFDEVTGKGCINNMNGSTVGISDDVDPLHSRNYGACMCARREDLLAIGGADEAMDYLGHICGPYDMTFRLFNYGCKEIWHETEFIYHTWHPGQAGFGNYLGPHDGLHLSLTALDSLKERRTEPYVMNRAIRDLKDGLALSSDVLEAKLIDKRNLVDWRHDEIENLTRSGHVADAAAYLGNYLGYRIFREENTICAQLLMSAWPAGYDWTSYGKSCVLIKGNTRDEVASIIRSLIPNKVVLLSSIGMVYAYVLNVVYRVAKYINKGILKSARSVVGRFAKG